MKPAPFVYHAPRTVDEAIATMAAVAGEEGRVLAGGQSLVPAMALRLARPGHLVDINRVAGFDELLVSGNGISISACVRHQACNSHRVPGTLGRLLETVRDHVAHLPIRQRGTFCGSLANADPASEWCLVAITLGGAVELRSVRSTRTLASEAFLLGHMTTAAEADEIVVAAQLPLLGDNVRSGFYEYARRRGDFAEAMALATFEVRNGAIVHPRIGVGAVVSRPRRVEAAEKALSGHQPGAAAFAAAGEATAKALFPEAPGSRLGRLAAGAVVRSLERAA